MGYYTRYELSVDDYDKHAEEIAVSSGYSDLFDDEIKWYSHESDMRSHSKKYPNILFELHGEGEENGDIWIEYYIDGKMQRAKAKIRFDDCDADKLK